MTIGKRISKLRTEHGFSQEYLAEQMNVSRQAVSKWEHDLSSPDTGNLIKLAALFGVTVEYLATGKDTAAPPKKNRSAIIHTLKQLSLVFFLIALGAHCAGIFSGVFTDNLIPVFPYLWYGKSAWAIVLNVFTVLFTIGWISLLFAANRLDQTD